MSKYARTGEFLAQARRESKKKAAAPHSLPLSGATNEGCTAGKTFSLHPCCCDSYPNPSSRQVIVTNFLIIYEESAQPVTDSPRRRRSFT
jgi:hypothetical protein